MHIQHYDILSTTRFWNVDLTKFLIVVMVLYSRILYV